MSSTDQCDCRAKEAKQPLALSLVHQLHRSPPNCISYCCFPTREEEIDATACLGSSCCGAERGLPGGGVKLPEDTKYMVRVSGSHFSLAISSRPYGFYLVFLLLRDMPLPFLPSTCIYFYNKKKYNTLKISVIKCKCHNALP